MKKVSISLFAVLAIVLATASAFSPKFAVTYKVRGILTTNQPATTPPAAPLWYEQNGTIVAQRTTSAYSAAELNAFQTARCISSSKVCLASLQVDDATTPVTVSLLATRPGDFF
jgi:hypothetical protein